MKRVLLFILLAPGRHVRYPFEPALSDHVVAWAFLLGEALFFYWMLGYW